MAIITTEQFELKEKTTELQNNNFKMKHFQYMKNRETFPSRL